MELSDYILKKAFENSNFVIETLKQFYKDHNKSMIFIGGSISRFEALPMSDIDLVTIGYQPIIDKNTFNKSFDRVDNLKINDTSQAQRLLNTMSPEGGFIDSTPITEVKNPFYSKFNSRSYLINKLIYEYYNSRFFNDRTDENGFNLKYTPGGYRDILIINICSRIFNQSTNYNCPEIQVSISNLKSKIDYEENYDDLLNDIAFIMLTKTIILSSYQDSTSRGFTQLNQSTLETAYKVNNEFRSFLPKSKELFWSKYFHAKNNIKNFIDNTLSNIMTLFKNEIWEESKQYLSLINTEKLRIRNLKDDILQSDYHPILSALIQGNLINNEQINELALKFQNDSGHYYTNRLLAKSSKTSQNTLKFMLMNSRFAIDNYTNSRYIKLIERSLKNEN